MHVEAAALMVERAADLFDKGDDARAAGALSMSDWPACGLIRDGRQLTHRAGFTHNQLSGLTFLIPLSGPF